MLRRLHIRNFVLIDEADLDLAQGFTVITGETGSGKSILLGALSLAMGERADAGALRDGTKRCVIELEVDLGRLDLGAWFEAQELPFETHTILRRQLEPGGRSRAFINDTPVRLEQLRELAARLVHVHSQHHTLLLNDARFQLGLVDHLAGQQAAAERYARDHATWRSLRRDLEELREAEARSQAEAEFIRFQHDELEAADLKVGEQEELEKQLGRADHAEELLHALGQVSEGMDGDQGILFALAKLRQLLAKPARHDAGVQALLERLDSVHIELKDVAATAGDLTSGMVVDPREAERLRERLDLILRLQQKHRVASEQELDELLSDMARRLDEVGSMADRIVAMEAGEHRLLELLLAQAAELSRGRTKAMAPLATKVEKLLRDLGMPHAVFRFDHKVTEEPGPQGYDSIRALFSANKDRQPAALDKVASGGELGRVMLALISLAADSQDLPTVIFDEIDTGVSGEVADRVGALMARMGAERQVLAITHLPQIAGKARHHLFVSKTEKAGRVRTGIDPLLGEARVEAIARMLSGRKLTKVAMENARELLGA
jgi:DNA repair protein RecN (Recombination protein N)